MPTVLTADELRTRFTGAKRSLLYNDAVRLYMQLKVHADGDMPIWLIKKARPNESDEVRAYRESIYEPETQNPVARVFNLLEKIRRSPDWMIRFPADVPPIINKAETLEKYLRNDYPEYGDIENWLFEEALRNCGVDVNAVIAVIPLSFDMAGTEYLQPVARIFNCQNVVDYRIDDFAVLKSEEHSGLLSPEEQVRRHNDNTTLAKALGINDEHAYVQFSAGQVYYVITTSLYQRWEINPEGKYILTKQMSHGLAALPVFKIPGKFVKRAGTDVLKRSPLHAMVPHLNKAARESNDLDAGVIMHLFLEKWRINNTECKSCKGTGSVPTIKGIGECTSCKGTGMSTGKSPFNEVVVQMKALTAGQNIPVPPLGYVEKNPEILRLQNERVEAHIYKALEAVNMEHLADVQLNQSGTAKEYDRDEMNNTIYAFAEALCSIANQAIFWINELRYKSVVQSIEQRRAMLPIIPVPEKYDVINSSFLIAEYQTAKAAGLSSIILAELQKEIAEKKFYANPEVAAFLQTVMELDPFPDKTIEEKSLMESAGLAAKTDIILSNYIADFVKQAMEEDQNFITKTAGRKRDVLMTYASKKLTALGSAAPLRQDLFSNVNDDTNLA